MLLSGKDPVSHEGVTYSIGNVVHNAVIVWCGQTVARLWWSLLQVCKCWITVIYTLN